jgi:hypothetical protein
MLDPNRPFKDVGVTIRDTKFADCAISDIWFLVLAISRGRGATTEEIQGGSN